MANKDKKIKASDAAFIAGLTSMAAITFAMKSDEIAGMLVAVTSGLIAGSAATIAKHYKASIAASFLSATLSATSIGMDVFDLNHDENNTAQAQNTIEAIQNNENEPYNISNTDEPIIIIP